MYGSGKFPSELPHWNIRWFGRGLIGTTALLILAQNGFVDKYFSVALLFRIQDRDLYLETQDMQPAPYSLISGALLTSLIRATLVFLGQRLDLWSISDAMVHSCVTESTESCIRAELVGP